MDRKGVAPGAVFALMALFTGVPHRFEGRRPVQAGFALAYALAVVALMRWGTRRPA